MEKLRGKETEPRKDGEGGGGRERERAPLSVGNPI